MVLNTADWVDGFAIFPLLIWMTKECILVNNPDNNADFLIPPNIDLFSNECIIKGGGMSPKCPKHYPKTWVRLIKMVHGSICGPEQSEETPARLHTPSLVQIYGGVHGQPTMKSPS
jgi:hypothetical protein